MAKSGNVGQKGTKTSSQKKTSAKAVNTNSAGCMFIVDPFILCAAIAVVMKNPQRIRELVSTPYAMLRYAIANQITKFVKEYKAYMVKKYGENHSYSSFDVKEVTDFIVGSDLVEAMRLSVETFRNAAAKYESEGMAKGTRLVIDSADAIEAVFNSSVIRGEVYFRSEDCEPLVRLTAAREVSSALQAACTQLSIHLAITVPTLIRTFHEQNKDKNDRPLEVDIDSAIRSAAVCYKPGAVVEKNSSIAFSVLTYHESGDMTAMQLFRAYFHAKRADAIRGLVALSTALYSIEYRLSQGRSFETMYEAIMGSAKNREYVKDVLFGMNPTGQELLDYVENKLLSLFDVCIPHSEYISFRKRLEKDGALGASVLSVIKEYRSTRKDAKGEKAYNYFVEAMNTRYRSRLCDIIVGDKEAKSA